MKYPRFAFTSTMNKMIKQILILQKEDSSKYLFFSEAKAF